MHKHDSNDLPQQKLNVGIIAYTTFQGGGLMNFLIQAIQSLSQARQNWKFHIICSISIPEIEQCKSDNVNIQYWDNNFRTSIMFSIGKLVLRLLGKEKDAGFLLQKRAEMYGFPWGKREKQVVLFKNMDVLWLPHYNISLDNLAFSHDLPDVYPPILLTIHDIHPFFYPKDHPEADLTRFYEGMVPFAEKCQQIVTHSQFHKTEISKNLGIKVEKISVTPQPPLHKPEILLGRHQPGFANQIMKQHGISPSFVFYPASTTYIHKNHSSLLKAWAELKKELGEQCPLLVCTGKGNRNRYKKILTQVKALHLEEDVIFTGGVDPSVLAVLYQNCSFVVIPTLFEGAGSGILTDALMAGKPVACSDIPQIREQLTALGDISVTFFNPEQISEVTKSLLTINSDIEHQKQIALENQICIKQRFMQMWQNWAEDYAKLILNIANTDAIE